MDHLLLALVFLILTITAGLAYLYWSKKLFKPENTAEVCKNDIFYYFLDSQSKDSKEVFILCHGIAVNSNHFWLSPWPEQCRARNAHVVVLDLRKIYSKNVNFDELFRLVVPHTIDEIKGRYGEVKINWVGHSLGGMIALAYFSRFGVEKSIDKLICIGSPIPMGRTGSSLLIPETGWLSKFLGVIPLRFYSRQISYFYPLLSFGLDRIFINPEGLNRIHIRKLLRWGIENVPVKLLNQLQTAFSEGELRSSGGSFNYTFGLGYLEIPCLWVGGSVDNVAPALNIEKMISRIENPNISFKLAGKFDGLKRDYGHGDLITHQDSFSEFSNWLDE